MSFVTTVTLMCPHPLDASAGTKLLEQLNNVLLQSQPNQREYAPEFARVDNHFGGGKSAEHLVLGVAVNYLDAEGFIARFCELEWQDGDALAQVVLVLQREDAPARIVFASGFEMQEQGKPGRKWF